jgi:hypothetical protein
MGLLFSRFFFIAPVRAHAGAGLFLISSVTGSVFSSFSALVKAAGVLCSDFIFPFLVPNLAADFSVRWPVSLISTSRASVRFIRLHDFIQEHARGKTPFHETVSAEFAYAELASSSRFLMSLDAKCFSSLPVCVVENLAAVLCCLTACTHVSFFGSQGVLT